jgi:predicted RNA-binding protein
MTCWIIPVSEANWEVIKKLNVYGAPEDSAAPKLIKAGDYLVFYVTVKGSRALGGKFVGVYRAVSDWFREDKPLWPDEVAENRVKYPWRIRIEPVKLGVADFKELVDKLTFTKGRKMPQAMLVGTPANMRRPIPEEDLKTILDSLKLYSM